MLKKQLGNANSGVVVTSNDNFGVLYQADVIAKEVKNEVYRK